MRAKLLCGSLLVFSFLFGAVLLTQADDIVSSDDVVATDAQDTAAVVDSTEDNAVVADEAAGISNLLAADWHETMDEWCAWAWGQAEEHPYMGASGLAAFMGTLFYMLSNVLRNEAVIEAVKREMVKSDREIKKAPCDCSTRGCSCLVKGKCPCSKDRKGCGCSKSRKGHRRAKKLYKKCAKKGAGRLTSRDSANCPFLKALMNLLKNYDGGCPYLDACLDK